MAGHMTRASPRGATWVVSEMPGRGCRVVQEAEGPPEVGNDMGREDQRAQAGAASSMGFRAGSSAG